MIILENTQWNRVTGGRSRQVAAVSQRPGLPDVIVVRINEPYPGDRLNPFRVGSEIYLRTRHYHSKGRVFYVEQDPFSVYVRIPYKGEDYAGGVISLDPVIGEHVRFNSFDMEDVYKAREKYRKYDKIVLCGVLALAAYFLLLKN